MQNLDKLLNTIIDDYRKFDPKMSDYTKTQIQKMESGETLRVETGKKYLKIIRDGSVWGFIVNTDLDKDFQMGDILMAASWKTPARNKARGNVLDGDFSMVHWTGPSYL